MELNTRTASWLTMQLRDVVRIECSAVVPQPGETYRYLGLEHIEQQTGRILQAPETDGSSIQSLKYSFSPGHILYGKLRPNLNKVAVPDFSGVCSTDILPLAVRGIALPAYVAFFLRSGRFVHHAVTHATGTKMPRFGPQQLLQTPIPIPPLPVQERIVQVLEKADSICGKRQEALQLADAILPAMHRDVFGEPLANPRGWKIDTLGNYLTETRYGTSAKAEQYQEGLPVLRIPNVVRRTIDTRELKYLRVSEKEREKLLLRSGDILVVRTNGNKDYVGRCAVFDLDGPYLFASYLIRLRLDLAHLSPHYVVAYLATSAGRQEVDGQSRTSAGQYNISAEGLKSIRIPVPPLLYQEKFVAQYEQWRASKARLEGSLREAEGAFSSLLARAFTGELTAEWEAANAEWIAQQQKES